MPLKVYKHHILLKEAVHTTFEGIIIEIEIIADFVNVGYETLPLGTDYLQRYKEKRITAVGTLSDGELTIRVAKGSTNLSSFQGTAIRRMAKSMTPLYAFNKPFEEGCYYWNSNRQFLEIDYELREIAYENKQNVTNSLEIDNYNDPFHGSGKKCMDAFLSGGLKKVVAHNRACLLKEHQILLERGAKKIAAKWLDTPI